VSKSDVLKSCEFYSSDSYQQRLAFCAKELKKPTASCTVCSSTTDCPDFVR
jgi:hypothetical protein